MKLHAALVCVMLCGGAAATEYRLDPQHSFVHFEVLHFGTSTLRGRFGPLDGQASLDAPAGRGRTGLRIPMASLSTGLPVLDRRLREADLLAVDAYPEAYFVAEHFVFEDGALREVRGEVTLRGISRPLTLRALRFGCRPHPTLQRDWCGGDFETELRRSDFGMTFGLPLVADRVRLLIEVEALRE
ncbi:MAG: YceI family protein [Piscinibacter sp.]|nr:YceI family protein [Piscinibacter sp.]